MLSVTVITEPGAVNSFSVTGPEYTHALEPYVGGRSIAADARHFVLPCLRFGIASAQQHLADLLHRVRPGTKYEEHAYV